MTKETKKQDSPAMQLLQLVWDNEGAGASRSWDRRNSSMASALRLAIESLFKFDADDFGEFSDRFVFGRWGGVGGGFAERFYSFACANELGRSRFGPNRSACISFENFKRREPFIYKSRRCISGERLACGSRFLWSDGSSDQDARPLVLTVTSFAKDGQSLTACEYAERDYPQKIKRRFKITVEALRAQNARVVKASKNEE